MAKRRFLSVLAVPATASALLGGVPAVADAATAAQSGGTSMSGGSAFGPLTTSLAAKLALNVNDPVIVILNGQAAAGSAAPASSAAVASSQGALLSELQQVGATGIKRFTLVNSVAATVSAFEAKRLAADPAVAQVIPDTTFTVPGPTFASPAAAGAASQARSSAAASPAKATSRHLGDIPGACAPTHKSQLAPEGLALTNTVSGNAKAPTARSLGFTGAGVKVAYIADGLDPNNVNFKRSNGTSVFTDYKDFTGNGPNAPTTGGEAFLDANTIAGQGTHVYNLNGYSAESYTGTTCDVQIQGVAPGASLVGLDAFSGDQADTLAATTSMFAQTINYAVETDKVNVLNESFGANTLPDTTQDVIKLFDDAAVKAGVVVSVSSGDAGTANTVGSPATDPNVISVGATTQFQALAQANNNGTRYFATKGWLSDNISSFSSAGYDEAGGTVDLVAPGDLSWVSCDASARYSECVNDLGQPSDFAEAGGTSESAPFVSGAAALVIQAFRKTHGKSPTPLQVKQILLSTATDLGTPAQEQGAGLLNSDKAVQLAESYGIAKRTGNTLLFSPGQMTVSALPGTRKTWKVTVANEGTRTQTVALSSRALNPASTSSASGAVALSDSTSNQYEADSGRPANYASFKFKVPAGQSRLDVSIAYAADPRSVIHPPNLVLFDPDGRVAADSEPQGVGNYGNVDVRAPVAGTWTGVIAGPPAGQGGYNGKVVWQEATQNYSSFGSISPSSLSLAPGQEKTFVLSVTAPANPGDLAGSVLLHSSRSGVASIPVVVRSQVNVAKGNGRFTGNLTGGNGRGALGTGDYYQFTVPSGTKAVRAELQLHDNPGIGNIVGAYLAGPDGNVAGYGQNTDLSGEQLGITDLTLTATALNPRAGTWTLIVAFAEPVAGTEVSDPYAGAVNFATAATMTPATPLPDSPSYSVAVGMPQTIPVTIKNTSNAPQDYFLDPRLNASTTVRLAWLISGTEAPFANGPATTALPIKQGATTSLYFVPTLTSSLKLNQVSSVAAMTDLSTAIGGDPDVGIAGLTKSSLCGKSVSESYTPSGGTVTSGIWTPAPTECGPYGAKGADKGTATDALYATTAGFDNSVTTPNGDFEQLATSVNAGNTGIENVVELQPGKSATVNVTFTATDPVGTTDSGTLYLDSLQSGVPAYGQLAGDEVAALPYSFTADIHD